VTKKSYWQRLPGKWRLWPLESRVGYYTKQDWSSDDACWLWSGPLTAAGYGQLSYKGAVVLAHREAWKLAHGEVPAGLRVLHECAHKQCVRPSHLRVGKKSRPSSVTRTRRGERHANARISDGQVSEVHALADAGVKKAAIARRFGISRMHVWRILAGRSRTSSA